MIHAVQDRTVFNQYFFLFYNNNSSEQVIQRLYKDLAVFH